MKNKPTPLLIIAVAMAIPMLMVLAITLVSAFNIFVEIGYPNNLLLVLSIAVIYFSVLYLDTTIDIIVFLLNKDK